MTSEEAGITGQEAGIIGQEAGMDRGLPSAARLLRLIGLPVFIINGEDWQVVEFTSAIANDGRPCCRSIRSPFRQTVSQEFGSRPHDNAGREWFFPDRFDHSNRRC